MREQKETEINSTIFQAKERGKILKYEDANIVILEELIEIYHSESLKIYLSLNDRAIKHTELEQCLEHRN